MSTCMWCEEQFPLMRHLPHRHWCEGDGLYFEAWCRKFTETILHVRPVCIGNWPNQQWSVDFVLVDYSTHKSSEVRVPAEKFDKAQASTIQIINERDYLEVMLELEKATPNNCTNCHGSGHVMYEYGSSIDTEPTQVEEECESCGGTGRAA